MAKPTRAPIAERIRLLAGRDNLSQAAVAEKLSKPQTSVSSWFRGVYDPGPDDLVALSRLFGCTADYLLGMVDAPTGVDPGSWLIDLEVVDAIQTSSTLVELTSRIGRSALDQGQDFAWGLKVPQRARIIRRREFEALRHQVAERMSELRARRAPKQLSKKDPRDAHRHG